MRAYAHNRHGGKAIADMEQRIRTNYNVAALVRDTDAPFDIARCRTDFPRRYHDYVLSCTPN